MNMLIVLVPKNGRKRIITAAMIPHLKSRLINVPLSISRLTIT